MGRKLYQNDMIHIRKASFRKKMQLQRTDACHLGIRPERLENPKAIHYDYCALGTHTHTHAFHVEILRATATVCFPTNATMHGIFEALDHMGKQQKKARGQGSQVKWLEADNRIEWNIQVNFAFVVGHCLNLSDPKNQYTHTHTTPPKRFRMFCVIRVSGCGVWVVHWEPKTALPASMWRRGAENWDMKNENTTAHFKTEIATVIEYEIDRLRKFSTKR